MRRNSILTTKRDNLIVREFNPLLLRAKPAPRSCGKTKQKRLVRGNLDSKNHTSTATKFNILQLPMKLRTQKRRQVFLFLHFSHFSTAVTELSEVSFCLTLTITGDERAAVSAVRLQFALLRGCLAGGPLHEEVVFAESALPNCSSIQ